MQRTRSLALPAAICVAIAGACHDAPLAPKPQARDRAIAPQTQLRVATFSGQAADSVLELLEPAWSKHDSSRPTASRLAWRRRNHVPPRILGGLTPSPILTSDGSTQAPQILSYYEKLYFGSHTPSSSIPSGINAEMTFIGDQGEIDLASVIISPDGGAAPYATSGKIVQGPGETVNCTDITLGGCTNRHLAGVMTFAGAPDCNAHASGTVAYYAAFTSSLLGFSGGSLSTSGLPTASSSAPFSATAPACTTQTSTGGTTSDTSSTSGTGTVGPPPAPTGPGVPTAPPPPESPTSGAGGGFYCQETDLYSVYGGSRTLIMTVIDCYSDT